MATLFTHGVDRHDQAYEVFLTRFLGAAGSLCTFAFLCFERLNVQSELALFNLYNYQDIKIFGIMWGQVNIMFYSVNNTGVLYTFVLVRIKSVNLP